MTDTTQPTTDLDLARRKLGIATLAARYTDLGEDDAGIIATAILRRRLTAEDLVFLAVLAEYHTEIDRRIQGDADPAVDADFGGQAAAMDYLQNEYNRLLTALVGGAR